MSKININGIEVECNPRRFNHTYRELLDEETSLINAIKLNAEAVAMIIDMTPNRESSIALTHLETAVMWAVKGVIAGKSEKPGSPAWAARMGIGSAE